VERRRGRTARPRRALLLAMGTGYGQVFSVPFGYCDEGPLVIEGLPAECTFSQGWRNYLSGDAESFLLEPLDVVLFTIDELIAEGLQIAPEDAQVLRAIDFRTGYLAGVFQTVHGETGVYGTVVSLTDASGTWSLWIVHGVLSADEVWGLRAMQCGTAFAWRLHPAVEPCYLAHDACMARARRRYEADVRLADEVYKMCKRLNFWGNLGLDVVTTIGCTAAGPFVLVSVIGSQVVYISIYVGGRAYCAAQRRQAINSARGTREVAEALCHDRLDGCLEKRRPLMDMPPEYWADGLTGDAPGR